MRQKLIGYQSVSPQEMIETLGKGATNRGHHLRITVFASGLLVGLAGLAAIPAMSRADLGPVQLVSSASNGTPASYTTPNGRVSRDIAWSPDGTKIAFRSDATNLVPDPPADGQFEVYVKDLATGQTTMISREPDGSPDRGDAEEPQWSPDGTRLAFSLSTPPGGTSSARTWEIADLRSGKVTPLSQNDGMPVDPVIEFAWSPDGTKVAFETSDPSLPNDGSPYGNVYIKDLGTKFITLVSAPDNPQPGKAGANGPSETPAWSPNGRYLAFNSTASNLIANAHVGYLQEEVYVYDAETDKLSLASETLGGPPADGPNFDTFIAGSDYAYAFPTYEHWVWDPDSTRLLFASAADNLVAGNLTNHEQVYAKTLVTGDLQIVSATVDEVPGDNNSGGWAEWNPDATKVIFDSEASNLGAPAGSVFIKNIASGAISLVGVSGTGCGCGTASTWSPDGEWVSFLGRLGEGLQAKNILTGALAQIAPLSTPGLPSLESRPVWSPDGTRIAFEVNEANLLSGVGGDQIYMRQVGTAVASGGGHGGSGGGGGGSVPPSPHSVCDSYYLMDSRGSGEHYGLSTPGRIFAQEFSRLHPSASLGIATNPYPAVSLWGSWRAFLNLVGAGTGIPKLGAYHDSVVQGKHWLSTQIASRIVKCDHAKILLIGYSQGAQVTADVYQKISAGLRRHISGVALFGDPYFNPHDDVADRGKFGHALHGVLGHRPIFATDTHKHVLSYCHKYDLICQAPFTAFPVAAVRYKLSQHKNYKIESKQAADLFARS